jgi:hypothetical protein
VALVAAPPFQITVSNGVSTADRATLTQIINATLEVITSPRFAERLAGLGQQALWLDEDGETMHPRDVAQVYLGQHAVMGPRSSVVRMTKNPFKKSPSTGLTLNSPVTGTITLTKRSLRRWRNGTLVGRSCVVNTLAHEITHTVSQSAERGTYVFSDRGHEDHESAPFASYVVGSVAQCTMLERENAMTGSFAQCVEFWGTNFTNGTGCDR